MDYSTIKITSKKVSRNTVDIPTIEITSKKVRGNDVDFSTIEITSTKVRGNDVDFSISEITSKKYVETTWKFVEIWSSTYPQNIHLESTSIRRGMPFEYLPQNIFFGKSDCYYCLPTVFFHATTFPEIFKEQIMRQKPA